MATWVKIRKTYEDALNEQAQAVLYTQKKFRALGRLNSGEMTTEEKEEIILSQDKRRLEQSAHELRNRKDSAVLCARIFAKLIN